MPYNHKTYIKPEVKMYDLICENQCFLLFLQHFNIDFSVDNKTIEQICNENGYSLNAFMAIANLYNDFFPEPGKEYSIADLETVLKFLKNNHHFYLSEKYPDLLQYINQLSESHTGDDIKLIRKFFADYFNEVKEHMNYEDTNVFPYINSLIQNIKYESKFAARVYKEHHSDIETKLTDLRSFFLRHLQIPNNLSTKRQFLRSLKELEFDLTLHSRIEELILIPIVEQIELSQNG